MLTDRMKEIAREIANDLFTDAQGNPIEAVPMSNGAAWKREVVEIRICTWLENLGACNVVSTSSEHDHGRGDNGKLPTQSVEPPSKGSD
jgi:hypothetical protein